MRYGRGQRRLLFIECLRCRFYYSGRTELQAVQENKQKSRIAKVFVRSPSKRLNGDNGTCTSSSSEANNSNGKGGKAPRPHDNKVTSKQSVPRKAWDEDHGPFILDQVAARATYDSPQHNGSGAPNGSGSNGQSLHFNSMESGHLVLNEEGLVNVRLVADEQGRFGFNVKGGADLKMPVLVSRVAPHTPADLSSPRISEGDQVLMINGRDIGALRHEQVVSLIRASREFRGGELVLTIKPQGEEGSSWRREHNADTERFPIACFSPRGHD